MKLKVLITGGRGYIARNLVPLFEAAKYEVLAPSRIELDLLNLDLIHGYLLKHQPDAIIHTAVKGGRRGQKDTFEDVFLPNLKMFENLWASAAWNSTTPVITLGSGAEFDRRTPIHMCREETVLNRWPIDPYGLSKNIITRQSLATRGFYVLRLFGCFNYDDDPSRFIGAGIQNLKRGIPIEIHQDRMMDYFFLDDIFPVIDYILQNGSSERNINLVYPEKRSLWEIANMITKHMPMIQGPQVLMKVMESGLPYTGCSDTLYSLPIASKLIGLEEGIRRTVNKLT